MRHPTVSQREEQVISIDASQDEEQHTETFTEDPLEALEKRAGENRYLAIASSTAIHNCECMKRSLQAAFRSMDQSWVAQM
jgi:hypothetical protein